MNLLEYAKHFRKFNPLQCIRIFIVTTWSIGHMQPMFDFCVALDMKTELSIQYCMVR